MILLRPDCLVFKTNQGEQIPCSVEEVTVELLGDPGGALDKDLIKNAAEAVLHYFKTELGQTTVSVGEFSLALEQALRSLGLEAKATGAEAVAPRVIEADLRLLARESGRGFELLFFPRLRDELRLKLDESPQLLRFSGLRDCVKQLTGARRWSGRCQNLTDQIVEYLRICLSAERGARSCALVVQ